jgi:hypothetical protein
MKRFPGWIPALIALSLTASLLILPWGTKIDHIPANKVEARTMTLQIADALIQFEADHGGWPWGATGPVPSCLGTHRVLVELAPANRDLAPGRHGPTQHHETYLSHAGAVSD